VAAALAQRTTEGRAHRDGARSSETESGLGWPGPPVSPGGGGLGWPGDAGSPASPAEQAEGSEQADDGQAVEEPAPQAARRGWRRLLGVNHAA
jgi:hypothetical protein